MDVRQYLERTTDPAERTAEYKALVSQYYDAVTGFYRLGWGEFFHFAPFYGNESREEALLAMHKLLVRETGIAAEMKVLDVGCGVGGPGRSIARMTGALITGITISRAQVKTAERLSRKQGLLDRFDVVLEDAMNMTFEDNAFDAVYMIESACHMPDKRRFYKECARVLKPGGMLAGWDWIQLRSAGNTDRDSYEEPICAHFALPSLSTLNEINDHINAAGLDVLKVEDMGHHGTAGRRWWAPLEQQINHPVARLTARMSKTLSMMWTSGDLLVSAGKAKRFSPLGFFVSRKPIC